MNHRTAPEHDGRDRSSGSGGVVAGRPGAAGRRTRPRRTGARRTSSVLVLGLALLLAACGVELNDELTAVPAPPAPPAPPEPGPDPDGTTTTTEARRTTTTAAPTTTTTTRPAPAFGDGLHAVNRDIPPGRYVTEGGENCYWRRLSALSDEFEAIIAIENARHRGVVDVLESDVGFDSSSCGRWYEWSAPEEAATSFGDGDWVVGHEIQHGVYQMVEPGDGESCYFELSRGFTHDLDEIVENDIPDDRGLIELRETGLRFTSDDCGTWEKLS